MLIKDKAASVEGIKQLYDIIEKDIGAVEEETNRLKADLTDVEKRLKSGKIEDAELHLGFYLDDNGDLCQED